MSGFEVETGGIRQRHDASGTSSRHRNAAELKQLSQEMRGPGSGIPLSYLLDFGLFIAVAIFIWIFVKHHHDLDLAPVVWKYFRPHYDEYDDEERSIDIL